MCAVFCTLLPNSLWYTVTVVLLVKTQQVLFSDARIILYLVPILQNIIKGALEYSKRGIVNSRRGSGVQTPPASVLDSLLISVSETIEPAKNAVNIFDFGPNFGQTLEKMPNFGQS
jgi:hypothetical protein